MALAAFDTLESVDALEKSGIPEKQARAISVVMRRAHESADVATKGDLERLDAGLRHEMRELELRLTGEMKLLKWMLGIVVISVVPLAIKTFLHF